MEKLYHKKKYLTVKRNHIRTKLLVFSNQENQEYLKKEDAILINHSHPTEIIKKYETFQIQFENPTINSSLKYTVNDKILNDENNKTKKNESKDNNKNKIFLMNSVKRADYNNFASNQGENNTNNGLLDINGHFKAEMLERNKLTCSFRKLKSNHLLSNKNSNSNFASNNGLFDENNSSSIKPPFQYSSINNKNQNNFNTYNSNLNNNYNTKETLTRRRTLYQSVNQSILNCSSLVAKIFWTKQEQRAKNIEDGFEKLQKLAGNLKIIENNHKNSRLTNILKYDDLFDILEFKGMGKEREIIDKNVQKKKKRINSEIRMPFKTSKNLNKIDEENASVFSEVKKNYNKNNYESHCKIDLNDKEINYNSDREIPTFNKENFLSLATLNSAKNKIKDFELTNSHSQKNICKEDYGTYVHNRNDRLKDSKKKNSLFSKDNQNEDEGKNSILSKLRELDGTDNDAASDDKENNKNTIFNNPFKLSKNPHTASKGLPPKNENLFTSSKKRDLPPHNFTTNKKLKMNEFNQSPNSRSPFKLPNANYNFKEKIELAAKIPFAVKKDTEDDKFKIDFSAEKDPENRKKDNYKKHTDLNKKSIFKTVNPEFSNQYKGSICEKNENYDSNSIKLHSNTSELDNNYNIDKNHKNPFKKNNKKIKTEYSSGNKILNNYASNYASNNYASNFNSNMKETSLIYKMNDNNYKSNYDTYDMKETINDNSHITSASIISCNADFDSNIHTSNLNNFNGHSNNLKTNDIYGSNSFGDYNSENVIDSQFCSNLTNFEQNNNFKSNYKNFKNDFDNYEEYESAMRKMELGIEDIPKKANKNANKNFNKNSTSRARNNKRNSINSNINNNATESDYISDYSKNSRLSSNSQINNYSYVTKSSISDVEI